MRLNFTMLFVILSLFTTLPQGVVARCYIGVYCTQEQAEAAIQAKLPELSQCGSCNPSSYGGKGCNPRDSWTISRCAPEGYLIANVPCFGEDGLFRCQYNIIERYSIDWRSCITAYYVRLPDDREISCYCGYLSALEEKDPDFELGAVPSGGAFCPYRSNPVNIVNGNKYESITDLSIATPFQEGFRLVRYYNSQSDTDGVAGYGWSHNYQVSLNPNHGEERIKILQGDGRGIYFLFDSATTNYIGTLGEKTVVETDGSTYTWKREDSLSYLFNSEGVLQEIWDAAGNRQVLAYDVGGRLESVTDEASGRSLQFIYNIEEKIERVIGPVTNAVADGIWAIYTYNNQNLSSVQYADSSGFSYTYADPNDPHNITRKEDQSGHLITSWTYDDQDRVISSEARDAENLTLDYLDENTTQTTDGYGTVRTYHFEEKGGIRRILFVDSPVGCSSCGEDVIGADYDLDSRLISRTMANGRIDRYADYDDLGRAQTVTLAEGTADERVIYYTYHPDQYGKLSQRETSVLGAGDKETIWDYDDDGDATPNEDPGPLVHRLIEKGFTRDASGTVVPYEYVTTFTYNAKGQITQVDGPLPGTGDVTTYTYNATTGNLETVDYPVVGEINYALYDTAGQAGRVIDENVQGTLLTYDGRGRLATETREADSYQIVNTYNNAGEIATRTDSEGFSLTYDYDTTYGRLATITDNFGNTIEYIYDANGNRIEEANFTSADVRTYWQRFSYDHPDQPGKLWKVINPDDTFTAYAYDAMGEVDTVTDPMGKVTDYTRDLMERITREARPGTVNTDYAYDTQGHPVTVTDPEGHVHTFAYDDMGRVVTETSPDRGTIAYVYDEAGRLVSRTDARGITSTYAYDDQNRITGISYPDTSENVIFSYDQGSYGTNRLTGIADGAGTIAYSYDDRGYLVTDQRVIDTVTYTTGYRYDPDGNLAGIDYPDGSAVDYSRDAAGRITDVVLTRQGIPQTLASYIEYKPFGPIAELDLGNGIQVSRGFDQLYRQETAVATGAMDLVFTRNASGDVTDITDQLFLTGDQTFTYDDLYRLTDADGDYGVLAYTYDMVGNRGTFTADAQVDSYAYVTGSNKLSAVTGANPETFTQDAAGNTTAIGTLTLVYNDAGRLEQVEDNLTSIGTYTYNALGQRVKKAAGGQTTIFHYDLDGKLIAESGVSGSFTKLYVYLEGEPLAMVDAATGSVYYYHTDHLGTPQRMTDSSAAIVWEAVYQPFGNAEVNPVSTVASNLRFAGQYFDAETNLHYNYHRYYDPATGRYLTPDPIGLEGGINLYAYVQNDPMNKIDPKGLTGFDPGPNPTIDPGVRIKPPYANPPWLPNDLTNRSKNCPPFYRVSGTDTLSGENGQPQVSHWEGLIPLTGEEEEPVPGSKCKVKIICYYSGDIYTGFDWATRKQVRNYFYGKKIEIIKTKENCCEE